LGHLRVKIPQLRLALEGKIRSHHRFLLRRLLDQIQFVEHEVALLDERLEDIGRQRPDLAQAVARWDTIPGLDRVAAWALLAEIGDNMGHCDRSGKGPVTVDILTREKGTIDGVFPVFEADIPAEPTQ